MPTTNNVLGNFEDYLTDIGLSPHTIKAYMHDVGKFFQWWEQTTGDDFDPKAIGSRDIVGYRAFLQQRGRAAATINRHLNALGRYFRWAKQQNPLLDNPFDILERVLIKDQQQRSAPGWLEEKEQLALLRAVRKNGSRRDLAIIRTLLGTGLRISEVVALEVADLDISDRKGSLRIRAGKGMKQRKIPLDKKTRVALSNYLAERPESESKKVFIGQRGPLTERGVDQLVAKYAYQARLEHCTAHSLRHSFAKNLVNAGTPLDRVATLLGHENLNTTRIYTKPSHQDLEKDIRRAAGEV